jgi:DNA-binding Xre family transcriptional regulator
MKDINKKTVEPSKKTKLSVLMFKKGVTSEWIKEKTGIGHTTISQIKNGRRTNSDLSTYQRIADAFEVKLEDVIGFDD